MFAKVPRTQLQIRDFEDFSHNADLYVFNDQTVQGDRGVNINTRDNEESLGEMHMKDYIDVSSQENTGPPFHRRLNVCINYISYMI